MAPLLPVVRDHTAMLHRSPARLYKGIVWGAAPAAVTADQGIKRGLASSASSSFPLSSIFEAGHSPTIVSDSTGLTLMERLTVPSLFRSYPTGVTSMC